MHREEQLKEIIERYIKGECSAEEISLLEEWFDQVSAGKDGNKALNAEDADRLARGLRDALASKKDRGRVLLFRSFSRAVAVWVGLLLLGGGLFLKLQWRSKRAVASQKDVFIEAVTGYQELKKIVLPDSSIVWLNSATHLSYNADFIHHRSVRLSGEAFFEVARDAAHPFVVEAGNASTVVFGTAFNISAYPAAGQLRISLQSGKIGVKQGDSQKMLLPGQLLIYDKERNVGEVVQQSPGEMNVWTTDRLLFYKTPLKEALAQIEARYGVHIVYDRLLKNQTITARFENTALEKVLEHLSFGWDLHFERQGDTLHVK